MIRKNVQELASLGPFPSYEAHPHPDLVGDYEKLLTDILPPVTDEEARVLVRLFGPDDFYGLAWAVIHLVETAPSWPIEECLQGNTEWILLLRKRLENAGLLNPT
jgi:hypothetical protein